MTLGAIALAAPASASDPGGDGSWDHSFQSWNGGASLYVEEHGDVIELCDSKADGYSAHATISWGAGAGQKFSLAVGGAGTCVESTAATHDIPEKSSTFSGRVDLAFWSGSTQSVNDIHYYINDH